MTINTAVIIYKALIRSIFDYGSYIFRNQNYKEKSWKKHNLSDYAQLQDIEIAHQRILEEAKKNNLRERAVILAENNIARIMIYGKEDLKNKKPSMETYKMIERMKKLRGRGSVIEETWKRVRKDRRIVIRKEGYENI